MNIFPGLNWPWNWKKEDVTCYSTCLAVVSTGAVGTCAVVGTNFVLPALGFGGAGNVAGPVPGPVAAVVLPPMRDMNAANPLAVLHMIILPLVETIGTMVLNRTVFPLCSAMCGSSEEKHVTDLKCYTHRNDRMKGLDEYLIRAEQVKTFKQCEDQCEEYIDCWSFRYLPTTSFYFLYKSQQHIEDNIYESQFYVKHCISCYMNATKNAKGRDNEIQTVWEVPSFKECENNCIKSDDCSAVHFDGKRCFKFNAKMEPKEITGFDFSAKICEEFNDI